MAGMSVKKSFTRMIMLSLALLIVLSAAILYHERSSLLAARQALVKTQIETAGTLIDAFRQRAARGELSDTDAREAARRAVSALRYGGNEYFWIHDTGLNMVMHPIRPELDGKSVAEMKDPAGKFLFREMNQVTAASGAGFVDYLWPKPGFDQPVAKISYVRQIPEWGWIVGTGIYLDDVRSAFIDSLIKLGTLVLGACLLLWLFLRRVAGSIMTQLGGEPAQAVEAAGRIARGDLSGRIELAAGDTDSLLASMQRMQSELQKALGEVGRMVEQAAAGDFSARIDLTDKQGFMRALCEQLNLLNDKLMLQLGGTPEEAVQAAQRIAAGDLDFAIALHNDNRHSILHAMHSMQQTLQHVIADVRQQVNAASRGDFSQRIDTAGKQGYARELTELLNQLNQTANAAFGDIAAACNALANGDLSCRITQHYPGRFGETADNINTTAENLTRVMQRIIDSVNLVTTAAGEISAGNLDLSRRTEQQASSLEETAASMEHFAVMVRANTQSAEAANRRAIETREQASASSQVVEASLGTMREIRASSARIHDIVDVINGIAFQTNILALNAAVEAARAGDSGRGFAVVATEVRALAQRSGLAAKEISQLVADTISKVETGSSQAERAGAAMQAIAAAITDVTEIVGNIARASSDQAQGIEQVSTALASMDETTQQNAALVEEAAAASESLRDQADVLKELVAAFRLESRGRQELLTLR